MTKLLFPSTLPAPKPIPGIETAVYQADEPLPEEHLDAQILAVWDTPRSLLKENVGRLKNLEYLQFLSSGVDAFTELNLPPSVVVAGGRSLHDLPGLLQTTDVLVMILPKRASTDNALNADVLAHLPKHAWVVNVGRGSTVDEEARCKTKWTPPTLTPTNPCSNH